MRTKTDAKLRLLAGGSWHQGGGEIMRNRRQVVVAGRCDHETQGLLIKTDAARWPIERWNHGLLVAVSISVCLHDVKIAGGSVTIHPEPCSVLGWVDPKVDTCVGACCAAFPGAAQGGGAFVFSGYKGRVWFAGFQIHGFPSEFHVSRMNFTCPCTENSNWGSECQNVGSREFHVSRMNFTCPE